MFIIWYQFRFPHGFQIRSPWSRKTRGALQLGKPEIHRIQEAGVWPDPACQILPHLLSCCPGPGQIGAAAVRGFGGEWCFQHSVFCDISCDTETLPYLPYLDLVKDSPKRGKAKYMQVISQLHPPSHL